MQLSLFNLIKPFFPKASKQVLSEKAQHVSPRLADDPDTLSLLWKSLWKEYFPHRRDLDAYTIVWSGRSQKRTLASCNIERKRIIVARELNHPDLHQWLSPLVYHEMCHAVLGFSVVNEDGRGAWHGAEFKALEARHPMMKSFDSWVKHPKGWSRAVRSDRSRRAHLKRKRILVS